MNTKTLGSLLVVALLASVLAIGCGQQGADRPKTVPVTGTVTHNGEPVEGATVAFQPVGGSKGAVGVTDASGKYALTTFESDDGAVPGEYKVKVFKYKVEGSEGGVADTDSADYVPPGMGEEGGQDDESGAPENLLPAQYADPTTSGLTATVSEGGDNNFDFPLEG